MKTILSIVAVLLILMGAIWALQGLSVLGGSFMVGQTRWIAIGLLTIAIGAGLLYYARRQRFL
jgi:cytochrome c biogenesis factor